MHTVIGHKLGELRASGNHATFGQALLKSDFSEGLKVSFRWDGVTLCRLPRHIKSSPPGAQSEAPLGRSHVNV